MNTKKKNLSAVGDPNILMIFKKFLLRKIIARISLLKEDFLQGIIRANLSFKYSPTGIMKANSKI